jgi:hypothetical protein
MHLHPVPVTILGGSDLRPGELPRSGQRQHPLAAYKGAEVSALGRPLVAHLVERLRAVEGFGPVVVAGPAATYAPLGLEAEIVDTDGSVGTNLRAAIERHVARPDAGALALLACDVLPETGDLRALRELYEDDAASALWYPLVRVPEDESRLGAFGWKPRYTLRRAGAATAEEVLPGHLAIVQPRAVRLPLVYRLLDVAYATRNRPLATRRRAMLRATLFALLARDLLGALRLRPPTLTATVLSSGLQFARELRAGTLAAREVERLIDGIFLRRSWRRELPACGARFPVVDVLTLAEDVDTLEEALELQRLRAESLRGTAPRRRP